MPSSPRTKRDYLQQLVFEKNRWNRPLTDEEKALGFLGRHERGYLPQCDYPGLIQFVTFRLADSMPASRRSEWEQLLTIEDARDKRAQLELYLDQGIGQCHLHDPSFARLTEDALLHFHEDRYELLVWCVMPNHVHLLVEIWQTPLWKLVRSWKQFVQTQANRLLTERRPPARRGDGAKDPAFPKKPIFQWEREYWDTFMRDESQEKKAVRYIENNPVKTKLCRAPEEWPFSSARLRDKFSQLVVPKKAGALASGTTSVTPNTAAPCRRPALL
ncbi:MAG: hypothetical protein ABJC04_10325 [Verrucomicrobiota bacterium]